MKRRRTWVAAGAAGILILGVTAFATTRGGSSEHPQASCHQERDGGRDAECAQGFVQPRKEAKFESSIGEADRKGPNSPAAEQVDNRAYPRSYVDDNLSKKSRTTYNGKGHKPTKTAFATTT